MATTSRLALPYPTPDDDVDVPADLQALADKLDSVVAIPDPGDLKFSARKNEHGNWIKADGRALAAGSYDALRDALIADGSPYGSTSGNPKLPDMRGRDAVGTGALDGSGTNYVHGASGGAEAHTLTAAQLPAHDHTIGGSIWQPKYGGVHPDQFNVYNPIPGYNAIDGWTQDPAASYVDSQPVGGGAAHNNMQPYTVGQWFIYGG